MQNFLLHFMRYKGKTAIISCVIGLVYSVVTIIYGIKENNLSTGAIVIAIIFLILTIWLIDKMYSKPTVWGPEIEDEDIDEEYEEDDYFEV